MPARKRRPGKCGTTTYVPPDQFDPSPEERLLLAIFGTKPGETWQQALVSMRNERGQR